MRCQIRLKILHILLEKFISNWIRKELLLSRTEININMDLFEFEKQIEDYRESLLILLINKKF